MEEDKKTIIFKVMSFRKGNKESKPQIPKDESKGSNKKPKEEGNKVEKKKVKQEEKKEVQQEVQQKTKKGSSFFAKKEVKKEEEVKEDKSLNKKSESVASEHRLPIVAYSNKNKYKSYHSREYGVNYNKDVAAYHYRGYDIKAPEVKAEDLETEEDNRPMQWVHYMSHAEKHPRKLPFYMHYTSEDNSFVQLVFILMFAAMIFTMFMSLICKYEKRIHRLLMYEFIWIPGCFGVVGTVYSVLCYPCSRRFPINYIIFIINVFSMSYMCGYVSAYHNTYGVVFATMCLSFIVLIFLLLAICDVDFTKFAVLFISLVLGVVVPLVFYNIAGRITDNWVPELDRHYNLVILGITTYSMSMILMLRLIIQNRTILLHEDDYAIATFIVYMCEICMFMKLVSHLGLFEENHR